jgi:FMN phosphatase YigB (HAD superfamily)
VLAAVAIICAVGGLAQIGFAFYALQRQKQAKNEIEAAAKGLTEAVKKRFEAGWPEEKDDQEQTYADVPAAADYVRALGELGAKLGSLTPPVAALLISAIPFALAVGLATLGELHG